MAMVANLVGVYYSFYTVFLSSSRNADDNTVSFELGVDRNHMNIETSCGFKLRGPHMCRSLKSILSRQGYRVNEITYRYIDSMPDPDEYLNSLDVPKEYHSLVHHVILNCNTK